MTWNELIARIPEDQRNNEVVILEEEALVFWNGSEVSQTTVWEAVENNEERFPDPASIGETGTALEVTCRRSKVTPEQVILMILR